VASYYNEIEPYAAEWLRNLIKAGHIADGEVDTRSIVDVHPFDLQGFDQCHFFAGIGGWSHALRLAGWPDSRPVWTGSCPCQPFSVAGKGGGVNDERHLWPHFHRLIRACRPSVVVGEQVAGKAGYGWFDGVRADLEEDHYACRAVDIPALAVNAPHIRQRLYWAACCVADGDDGGWQRRAWDGDGKRDRQAGERHEDHGLFAGCGEDCLDVADTQSFRSQEWKWAHGRQDTRSGAQSWVDSARAGAFWYDAIWLTGSDGKSRRIKPCLPLLVDGVSNRMGRLRAYGNAIVPPLAAEVIKAFMMGDDRWM
jgi:DNA (cytosine-5)-methyltransferase 1